MSIRRIENEPEFLADLEGCFKDLATEARNIQHYTSQAQRSAEIQKKLGDKAVNIIKLYRLDRAKEDKRWKEIDEILDRPSPKGMANGEIGPVWSSQPGRMEGEERWKEMDSLFDKIDKLLQPSDEWKRESVSRRKPTNDGDNLKVTVKRKHGGTRAVQTEKPPVLRSVIVKRHPTSKAFMKMRNEITEKLADCKNGKKRKKLRDSLYQVNNCYSEHRRMNHCRRCDSQGHWPHECQVSRHGKK